MIFICFDLFWFDWILRRNCFIELSSELSAPVLDRLKKKIGFCVFSIRYFKFWVRRLVSFRWWTVYCGRYQRHLSLAIENNWLEANSIQMEQKVFRNWYCSNWNRKSSRFIEIKILKRSKYSARDNIARNILKFRFKILKSFHDIYAPLWEISRYFSGEGP